VGYSIVKLYVHTSQLRRLQGRDLLVRTLMSRLILYLDYCGVSTFARYAALSCNLLSALQGESGGGSVAAVRPARETVEVLPAEDGRRRRPPAGRP